MFQMFYNTNYIELEKVLTEGLEVVVEDIEDGLVCGSTDVAGLLVDCC